jgi:hypothetical protein
MAYTLTIPADIGTTGLTLLASFVNTSGTLHASLRNLSCTETGTSGMYRFVSSSIDDGYRGQVYFHTGSITALSDLTTSNTYAVASINPQEVEYSDVKTSSIVTGSGSGAYSITVTVTDGSVALQNATVRVTEGANSFTLITDVNGQGTFSLDAATYTVSITKGGYSFTPTTRTVTGNETGTLVNDLAMTAVTATPPADPTLCLLHGSIVYPSGAVAVGVSVEATVKVVTPTAQGNVVVRQTSSAVTDSNGDFELELIRTDQYDPSATYKINCSAAGISISGVTLTTSTKDIADLL